MKKIYFLGSCSTCQRILEQLNLDSSFELQDLKKIPLNPKQLDQLKGLTGSYEALFSKRARLYKERGLKGKTLNEDDYKSYLLEHYTFLKRPVLVYEEAIFIGNSAKVTAAAITALQH